MTPRTPEELAHAEAELDASADRKATLRHAGLDEGALARAEEAFAVELADALRRGDASLVRRYRDAYAARAVGASGRAEPSARGAVADAENRPVSAAAASTTAATATEPFAAAGAAVVALRADVPISAPFEVSAHAGMDPDVTAPPFARSEPTLPFIARDIPRRATEAADVNIDETAAPFARAALPVLPFAALGTVPGDPLARAMAGDRREAATQGARDDGSDERTLAPLLAHPDSTLPFARPVEDPRAPWTPRLTVEQYASLCVDIELAPLRAGETAARYGLPGDARTAEDDAWRRGFAAQPDLWYQFKQAKAAYRKWGGA